MSNEIKRPLANISAEVCIVPKWLLTRLQSVGEPLTVLADSKKSANILSDEEIIYYINGVNQVLTLPVLGRLFNEGLGLWYVMKGNFSPPAAIFELLISAAELSYKELSAKYMKEYPEHFGHIVMGYYLRGPDSDVNLEAEWHVDFDAINVGKNIYITWEVKSGARLPHTESNICKKILMALEPYADRNALRQSSFYAKTVTCK